jgi:hypothetical protein
MPYCRVYSSSFLAEANGICDDEWIHFAFVLLCLRIPQNTRIPTEFHPLQPAVRQADPVCRNHASFPFIFVSYFPMSHPPRDDSDPPTARNSSAELGVRQGFTKPSQVWARFFLGRRGAFQSVVVFFLFAILILFATI